MTTAIKFIQDHGIDRARNVVNGSPHWPVIGWDAVGDNYIFKQCEHAPCSYSNLDNAWSEEYAIEMILLDDLNRLVESVELVKEHYTLDRAKRYASSPYTAPELKTRLKQAIADYEEVYPK